MTAFAKEKKEKKPQTTGHLQTQSLLFSPHPVKLGILNACLLNPQCENNLSACSFNAGCLPW